MRWLLYNRPGTLEVYAPALPAAAGTFTVYDLYGAIAQASRAAVFTTASTTLTAAAAAGATVLLVADSTGYVPGRKYLLGGAEDSGGEWVTCVSSGAGSVTINNALRRARAIGTTLQSTRVTFAIDAETIATPRALRLEWEWSSGADTMPALSLPFEVTRYSPVSYATFDDLRSLDAIASKRVPAALDFPSFRRITWDMLLDRVASKMPVGGVVGTIELTRPHLYLMLAVLMEPSAADPEKRAEIERLETRFKQEFDLVMSRIPLDRNQDGDAKTNEKGWSRQTINLRRG